MDSSDSLKLDENLARFLAAYDQEIEGGDPHAMTVNVPLAPGPDPLPNERQVTPLHPSSPNEGSFGEVLPDSNPTGSGRFMTIQDVAEELSRRLTRLFLRNESGRRPIFGGHKKLDRDPHFRGIAEGVPASAGSPVGIARRRIRRLNWARAALP